MWEFIKNLLVWLQNFIYESVTSALVYILESIPVPEFLSTLSTKGQLIPENVGYWLNALEVGYGLTIIFTALILRFTLRRIPIIG